MRRRLLLLGGALGRAEESGLRPGALGGDPLIGGSLTCSSRWQPGSGAPHLNRTNAAVGSTTHARALLAYSAVMGVKPTARDPTFRFNMSRPFLTRVVDRLAAVRVDGRTGARVKNGRVE